MRMLIVQINMYVQKHVQVIYVMHTCEMFFHALVCMHSARSPLCFHLSARLQCTCVVNVCLFTSVFHLLVWLQFTWVVYTCVSSPLRKLWISYSGDVCLSAKMPMAALAQTCYGSPVTYLHVVTWEVLSTTCETRNHEHFYMRPIWVLLFVRFCSKNYVHCHRRCNFNPIVGLVLKPFWKFECKFKTRSIRNNRRYSWHMYKCTNPLYESSQVSSNKLATYDGDESSHPLCRSSQV